MKLLRKVGSTSNIFNIFIRDSSSSTGGGLTGLTNASSGLTAYYCRDTDTGATSISVVSMTVGTFTSGGFKEISSSNMPGWYQFCPPDAALASGAKSVAIHLKGATNMAPLPIEIDLDGQVDVTHWNGTAVATPATAGIPDVNVKNLNNVVTTSVTTVNANVGTTQPTNFTGTGSSALVKSDTVDIAGAAVSTSSAQLGVNVVNINAVSAASVTTVNANVGTTQPTNFTGTGASALVKSDTVDIAGAAVATGTAQIGVNLVNIAGAAVSTSTAQLGVNAVNWAGGAIPSPNVTGVPKVDVTHFKGTASAGTAGYAGIDWSAINAPTTTVNLSGTTVGTVTTNSDKTGYSLSGTQTFNNTGTWTGNLTGNVGGNVTGTIGGYAAGQDPATLVLGATAASWNSAGTIGNKINAAGAAGDPWSTSLPGGYTTGQAGAIVGRVLQGGVNRIVGLSGENSVLMSAVYDAYGNLTSAVVPLYDSAANATTNNGVTGLVASYAISNTIAANVLSSSLQTRTA